MSRLKKAFRTNTGSIPTTSTPGGGSSNTLGLNGSSTGPGGGAGNAGHGTSASERNTPQSPAPAPMSGMNEFVLPALVEKEIELEVPESHKAIADKTFFGLENVSSRRRCRHRRQRQRPCPRSC